MYDFAQVRPVDRFIEVPVDKVVERIIEVPKPVDRSRLLNLTQQDESDDSYLYVAASRYVEVPHEVIQHVEVTKEVPVEVIKEVERLKEVVREVPIEVIREKVPLPTEPANYKMHFTVLDVIDWRLHSLQVVEKEVHIHVPVERFVEAPVERTVFKVRRFHAELMFHNKSKQIAKSNAMNEQDRTVFQDRLGAL